jgi:hypothetical protein
MKVTAMNEKSIVLNDSEAIFRETIMRAAVDDYFTHLERVPMLNRSWRTCPTGHHRAGKIETPFVAGTGCEDRDSVQSQKEKLRLHLGAPNDMAVDIYLKQRKSMSSNVSSGESQDNFIWLLPLVVLLAASRASRPCFQYLTLVGIPV